MDAFPALLGGVVGLTLALTGAGGGILAVPLLVFGLHLQVVQAAPVGLLAVGLAAALGAGLGLRDGSVRYRAALLIGVAGMLVAPLGVTLARHVPNRPLSIAFALVMIYTAWRMFMRSRAASGRNENAQLLPPCVRDASTGRFRWTRPCARTLALTGLLSGMLSGLLGVGGGFVIVPALSRWTDLESGGIVSTSLAVIALVSVSGVASAAAQGGMPWGIGLMFAAGSMGSLLICRRLIGNRSGALAQRAFAALSMVVAANLLYRSLH